MLKIKSIRSSVKRFKKTSSGGFKFKHANSRHLLTKKNKKRKRNFKKKNMVSKSNIYSVLQSLPYL